MMQRKNSPIALSESTITTCFLNLVLLLLCSRSLWHRILKRTREKQHTQHTSKRLLGLWRGKGKHGIPQLNGLHQAFTFVLNPLSHSRKGNISSHSTIILRMATTNNHLFFLIQETLSKCISRMELHHLVSKETYRSPCLSLRNTCLCVCVCCLPSIY